MKSVLQSVGIALALALSLTPCVAQTAGKTQPGAAAMIWIEPQLGNEPRSGLSPREIVRSEVWIEKLDDQAVVFRKGPEESRITIAESRLVWLEPQGISEPATAAMRSLYDRKSAVDIASLLKELKQPHPAWMSQWVGMHLWQATYLGEKHAATLELIDQLDAQPMPSVVIGGLPIRWSHENPSSIALAAAKDNLSDKREATLLTAASWLLGTEHDAEARSVLNRLAGESNRKSIAALANLLLEIELRAGGLSQLTATKLKAFERLPLTLSAGPTARMAAWYQLHGQSERAMEMSLRLILVSPRPNPLSHLPAESEQLWKELSVEAKRE